MDRLIREYEKVKEEREKKEKEIEKLKENEIIKKYFELRDENNKLSLKEKDLYEQIKRNDYTFCNHIWVNVLRDYDEYEGRTDVYCGCIKCGLDEKVLYLMDYNFNINSLARDQRVMYSFMHNENYKRGIHSKVFCDLDFARAIYKRIKTSHPDIDDKTALKYFEIALDNIRNIKVSDERKKSRAKRLSLSTKFNKWN